MAAVVSGLLSFWCYSSMLDVQLAVYDYNINADYDQLVQDHSAIARKGSVLFYFSAFFAATSFTLAGVLLLVRVLKNESEQINSSPIE